MEVVLVIGFFVISCVVVGCVIGSLLFPRTDYSGMARSMRQIRDWERENTPDQPSSLRHFKDTFK
jgi:hypothetical protein